MNPHVPFGTADFKSPGSPVCRAMLSDAALSVANPTSNRRSARRDVSRYVAIYPALRRISPHTAPETGVHSQALRVGEELSVVKGR